MKPQFCCHKYGKFRESWLFFFNEKRIQFHCFVNALCDNGQFQSNWFFLHFVASMTVLRLMKWIWSELPISQRYLLNSSDFFLLKYSQLHFSASIIFAFFYLINKLQSLSHKFSFSWYFFLHRAENTNFFIYRKKLRLKILIKMWISNG